MKLLNFTFVTAIVVLIVYLLVVGQALLLPLAIAIALWYLINVLAEGFAHIKLAGKILPRPACFTFSILTFFIAIWGLIELIGVNINAVVDVAPAYQANLEARINSVFLYFNIQQQAEFPQLFEFIDLRSIITSLASSITSVATNGGIIFIYVGFLLVEQGNFDAKLSALIDHAEREKSARKIFEKIRDDIRKYIGIKLFTSSMTASLSYLFLTTVGVDFAEFWAMLIFLLNFIPTIGSIIATAFPALITLVQFDHLTPFFIVVGGIGTLQIIIGNVIEPRLMGKSLNLSPIIILFNLALWGTIWGVPGMFLCVPFLVIIVIVLSHFPQTRPIAVILSRDGKISGY